MRSEPYLPAELAQYTLENLFVRHGWFGGMTYWLLLVGLAVTIGALPLLRVDVAVHARGVVRPRTERTELYAPISGRIAQVHARDNQRVSGGQVLVEFSTDEMDERFARMDALKQGKADYIADLEKLIALAQGLADDPRHNQATSTASVEHQSTMPFRTELARYEFSRHGAQVKASAVQIAQARATLDRTVQLHTDGLVSSQERDNVEYAYERAVAESDLLTRHSIAAWQALQKQEKNELEQLVSDERRLRAERALAIVRAPTAGTIQGLLGLVAGAYVVAGQYLGAVSPEDELRLEVSVPAKDIGFIQIGQRVSVEIDAYPCTRWGMIDAETESVGADTLVGATKPVFRVVLRLRRLTIERVDRSAGVIRKGMTATAHFLVSRASVFQLMMEDARELLDPRARLADPDPDLSPVHSIGW